MGKKVTIYESDNEAIANGHIFNHVKGYADVDEDRGEVTITDTPEGFAKIKDRFHFSIDSNNSDAGLAFNFGLILAVIIFLGVCIVFIPKFWVDLFDQFDEYFVECSVILVAGIITIIVAYRNGFKSGLSVATLIITVFEVFNNWHNLTHWDTPFDFFYIPMIPIMAAIGGAIPAGIGAIARKIYDFFKR
ncbi:hypothetical protein [Butyrivibrio fibrisolvens]|uniref:hypothetical protein n=1 Tax=Butyrivibrio fibrisolvens TaxID=831 RepID=UPI0003B615E4|nr:hypothetical protein [Butyrivibrio fibrisolvens]